MKRLRFSEGDAVLLLIVELLTLVPLSAVCLYAAFTPYILTPGPVLMIVGWFFGACMVWVYEKLKHSDNVG